MSKSLCLAAHKATVSSPSLTQRGRSVVEFEPADLFGWFASRLCLSETSVVTFAELHLLYKSSCKTQGMLPWNRNTFARAVKAYLSTPEFRGSVRVARTNHLFYRGVCLRTDAAVAGP